MKTLEEIKLIDIVPDSINKDVTVAAATEAIDPELKVVSENVDAPEIYINIDKLSGVALDHLAAQYDAATWRDYWDVELKRSVIKTVIADKRIVGTVLAVKNAIKSIGSSARIVEWWQKTPKGTPHTFTIYATFNDAQGDTTIDLQEDMRLLVDAAKPLRSHYELIIVQALTSGIGIYGDVRAVVYSRIG